MIMTDGFETATRVLNEDVEIGAAPAITVQRGTHGHRSFLGRMAGRIPALAFRAGINSTRGYCWGGGLINDLAHQLRRDGSGRWHGLVGRRRNLHRLFPLSNQQSVLPQYFYCVTRPVNKNLRIPCLVLVTQ